MRVLSNFEGGLVSGRGGNYFPSTGVGTVSFNGSILNNFQNTTPKPATLAFSAIGAGTAGYFSNTGSAVCGVIGNLYGAGAGFITGTLSGPVGGLTSSVTSAVVSNQVTTACTSGNPPPSMNHMGDPSPNYNGSQPDNSGGNTSNTNNACSNATYSCSSSSSSE